MIVRIRLYLHSSSFVTSSRFRRDPNLEIFRKNCPCRNPRFHRESFILMLVRLSVGARITGNDVVPLEFFRLFLCRSWIATRDLCTMAEM